MFEFAERILDCRDLGMITSAALVPPFADDLTTLDDDRANRWIRTRMPLTPFGEQQSTHQKTSVGIAQKHD